MSKNILLKKLEVRLKEETAKGRHVNPLLIAYETLKSAVSALDQAKIMQTTEEYYPTCEDALEFIDIIVANGEDINVKSKKGYGILHIFSYPEVIKKVVELGGDINLPAPSFSPLSFFIHKSCMDIKRSDKEFNRFYDTLKSYLELGADVNAGGAAAILMTATLDPTDKERKNVVKVLDLLYSYGADFNHVSKGFECSPLEITRDPELIRYLVQHGADPNKASGTKMPLRKALQEEEENAVKTLLELGADPNLQLDVLVPPVFALLHRSYYLDQAIDKANRLFSLLSEYGADFNATDVFGNTVLTEDRESYFPVETLVKLGANAAFVAPDGNTPLHRVAKSAPPVYTDKNYVIEDFYALLAAGADINAQNNLEETPFVVACENYCNTFYKHNPKGEYSTNYLKKHTDFLKALVREGADIKALTNLYGYGKPAIELLPKKLRKELEEIAEYRETLRNTIDNEVEMYER